MRQHVPDTQNIGTESGKAFGRFVYENGKLSYIIHPDGVVRAVYNTPGGGSVQINPEMGITIMPADGGEVLSGFTREIHLKDHLGNVRAVFDYSKLQSENHYYPFGLPIHNLCTSTAPEGKENRYLYNGKELQDDLGLNWMDYGARFYDAGIGRWHSVDPMAEVYINISPYVYCANNPMVFTDPNGMEITGDTTAVRNLENQARLFVKQEKSRQSRLQSKANKRAQKGKSTSRIQRRIERSKFRESQYQNTVNEIGVLRNSNTVYNINTSYHSEVNDGSVEYSGTNELGNHVININVSRNFVYSGGLAHELVHGYQFEIRQLDFQFNGSPGLLYDITDEISAYTRQFAFSGNPDMYNVTASIVRSITNSRGEYLYKGLPNGPLNTDSSLGYIDMMYSSQNQRLNISINAYEVLYRNAGFNLKYK